MIYYSTDMKLTQEQLKQAYNEVKVGHHEALATIVRLGGDKEDYKKLYEVLNGWSKL